MSYSYSKLNTYLELKEKFSDIIDIIENEKKEIRSLMDTICENNTGLFSQLDGYTDGSSGHLAQTYDGKMDIVRRKATRLYNNFIDAYERLCAEVDEAKSKKIFYAKKAEEEKRGLEELENEAIAKVTKIVSAIQNRQKG